MVAVSEAQQAKKLPHIGYLSGNSRASDLIRTEAFKVGLREVGYVEGRGIIVEWRYADGKADRIGDLAADLVRLNVDVIVVASATATKIVKEQTRTLPIVMTNVSDPVTLGFVQSLARPGGNLTGITNLAPELGAKRLELLKEIVPQFSRVAVLGDPGSPAYSAQLK